MAWHWRRRPGNTSNSKLNFSWAFEMQRQLFPNSKPLGLILTRKAANAMEVSNAYVYGVNENMRQSRWQDGWGHLLFEKKRNNHQNPTPHQPFNRPTPHTLFKKSQIQELSKYSTATSPCQKQRNRNQKKTSVLKRPKYHNATQKIKNKLAARSHKIRKTKQKKHMPQIP